jgi:anti-sigma regulatory factor (Ser/Thr protein kinase)
VDLNTSARDTSPMKHLLKNIENTRQGFESLAALAKTGIGLLGDKLVLDLSGCSFFAANMAAPLGAVLARIEADFNEVEIEGIRPNVETILRKNELLTHYGRSVLEDTNGTTLPFRRIQLNDGARFEGYIRRHFQGRGMPVMSDALAANLRQEMFEIFENAVAHSQSSAGVCVCGQFFPNKHRLDITISDAGIGIRQNVRRHLQQPKLNSVEAIRWVLEEGHSTKSGPQPGGLGLKLLKEFINFNRGRIHIVSRYGFYELANRKESFTKMANDLPGTTINIEINTSDGSAYRLSTDLSLDNIF